MNGPDLLDYEVPGRGHRRGRFLAAVIAPVISSYVVVLGIVAWVGATSDDLDASGLLLAVAAPAVALWGVVAHLYVLVFDPERLGLHSAIAGSAYVVCIVATYLWLRRRRASGRR